MYTIVYLTINLINFKIYIGVHDCKSDDYDFYLGQGCFANKPSTYQKKKTPFAYALRKYGPKNFRRVTLAKFENRQDALDLERKLVSEEFIKLKNNYNAVVGGGDPPRNDVTFYCYDLQGNYLKTCINMFQECKNRNISKDRIITAIKEKRSCDNCFWSYEKVDKLNMSEYKFSKRGYIHQYDKDRNFIAEYKSIQEASKILDLDVNLISNSLFRRSAPSGYYFIRSEENINDVLDNNIRESLVFYAYNINGELFKSYTDISIGINDVNGTRSGLKRAIFKESLYKDYY